jgi:hypothetical protein
MSDQTASPRRARCAALVIAGVLQVGGVLAAAARDLSSLGVIEIELTSDRVYDNPLWDVDVAVTATAPSGRTQRVNAFWDGGRTWRARFRGDESGVWTWRARSEESTEAVDGGPSAQGTIKHGDARPPRLLKASDDGTHLVDDAGEPFFWLADTAWNGALRSRDKDWQTYLALRAKQRFNAIQFVTTQWRGGDKVIPRHVFTGTQRITIDPQAFAALDAKIAAIVHAGLRPAPVMLWALNPTDPGQVLDEADAVRLARYEVARWGALAPAWLLGGDGCYLRDNGAPRWQRIGRAVFGDRPEQLVTLHPCGQTWLGDAFGPEDWFDFLGYQSGHGDGENDLRWLVEGPPAQSAKLGKPVINLEPNYEGHPAYQSGEPITAHMVRRAAYWSMLVHAPAGVTYGNNEIWCWNDTTADAENHGNLRQIRPWRDGLETEGIAAMTHLRAFFESGPWPRLRPAPDLVVDQPGHDDPNKFIALAQTDDGAWTVAYLPIGGRVTLNLNLADTQAEWVNPRDGVLHPVEPLSTDTTVTLTAPDNKDWLLSLRKAK